MFKCIQVGRPLASFDIRKICNLRRSHNAVGNNCKMGHKHYVFPSLWLNVHKLMRNIEEENAYASKMLNKLPYIEITFFWHRETKISCFDFEMWFHLISLYLSFSVCVCVFILIVVYSS